MWHFLFTGRIQVNNFATATFHGIISTNVKNISYTHQQNSQRQDHLHIRGEYLVRCLTMVDTVGSSPHTWRIRRTVLSGSVSFRIISTYVENTLNNNHIVVFRKDHLHIRGEYNFTPNISNFELGLSPHTWRILLILIWKNTHLRIISTYVENTSALSSVCFVYKDHLHIRGEYNINTAETNTIKGSSPHTWRIPQSAGNTSRVGQDHLHIRGEYLM